MKFFFLVISVFFLNGCLSQERKIVLINQSGLEIDSAIIGVSSADTYRIKLTKLKTSDTSTHVIPKNVPKSNKHDITVSVNIYIKDHKTIYGYSYDDLAGYLIGDYTFILNQDLKLK